MLKTWIVLFVFLNSVVSVGTLAASSCEGALKSPLFAQPLKVAKGAYERLRPPERWLSVSEKEARIVENTAVVAKIRGAVQAVSSAREALDLIEFLLDALGTSQGRELVYSSMARQSYKGLPEDKVLQLGVALENSRNLLISIDFAAPILRYKRQWGRDKVDQLTDRLEALFEQFSVYEPYGNNEAVQQMVPALLVALKAEKIANIDRFIEAGVVDEASIGYGQSSINNVSFVRALDQLPPRWRNWLDRQIPEMASRVPVANDRNTVRLAEHLWKLSHRKDLQRLAEELGSEVTAADLVAKIHSFPKPLTGQSGWGRGPYDYSLVIELVKVLREGLQGYLQQGEFFQFYGSFPNLNARLKSVRRGSYYKASDFDLLPSPGVIRRWKPLLKFDQETIEFSAEPKSSLPSEKLRVAAHRLSRELSDLARQLNRVARSEPSDMYDRTSYKTTLEQLSLREMYQFDSGVFRFQMDREGVSFVINHPAGELASFHRLILD